MILPADHPVLIPAVIPVTDVVMIPVRPGLLKTIQVLYLLIQSAEPLAGDVKTALREAALIPVLMPELQNAVLVINVMTHVLPDQKALVAEADMNLTAAVRLNAEVLATPAANILTLTPARAVINPAHADQVTQLPAQDLNLALVVQLPVPAINVPKILPATAIMITTITTPVAEIREITTITIITPIQEQPRLRMILMNVNQIQLILLA